MSILTAFGFRQFAQFLPSDRIVDRELVVSHLVSMMGRELIHCKILTQC
jgi:hypothetical protein